MYNDEINKVREKVFLDNQDVEKIDGVDRLLYLQCISSKNIFFPQFNEFSNIDFYLKVMFNQCMAKYDLENYLSIKSRTSVVSCLDTFLSPKIYCAFHYGSYRIINCVLHEQNIEFAVVANKVILDKSKEQLINLHNEALYRSEKKLDFELIDANSNSGLIAMLRALKKGKSLVIYIDGGNGVGGFKKDDKNTTVVNFLNKKIYSRIGVAFLSAKLNIPIVPVIAGRSVNFENIDIKFYKQIITAFNSKEEINRITQLVWGIFEKEVMQDPTQWEGLLYFHHFLQREDTIEMPIIFSNNYSFNYENFDFFCYSNNYYLYNNYSFSTIKLTQKLYNFLQFLHKDKNTFSYTKLLSYMHEEVLGDLIKHGILQ